MENINYVIYPIIAIGFVGLIILYWNNYQKRSKFLKSHPEKAYISYSGHERMQGVHVHRVLSQSLEGELKSLLLENKRTAGYFTVNPGEVELEVENITKSHSLLGNKITYTFHGKVRQTFVTEPGKKYSLQYNEKEGGFYLKEKS